jgi:hypothetical protein
MNCQIFSTELSSGDFGGSASVMLGGTGGVVETCHPAFNGLTTATTLYAFVSAGSAISVALKV